MPWPLAWLLGALLMLAAAASPPAGAEAARPGTVVLTDHSRPVQADALGSVWLDPRDTAVIDEVVQGPARFTPMLPGAVYRLAPGNALWIRLRLMRGIDDRQRWLLVFPNPEIDYVNVWQQDAHGQWRGQAAGVTVAMDSWAEPARYPYFRLDLPRGLPRDVYVQVRSVIPTSVPLRLASDSDHDQQIQIEYLGVGMVFGALVLLIAGCLAQSWVYRETVYGWYAAYAFISTLGTLAITGVGAHLLWTGSGFWADAARGSLISLSAGAATMFVRDLTGISARHRLLDRLALWGGQAGIAFAAAYPFLQRPTGLAILSGYAAFAMAVNVVVAVLSWRRGDKVGQWVLVAYLPLAVAVPLTLGRVLGWLPVSFLTQYAIVVGLGLQVPLLLIALSIRSRERHGAQVRELALSSQDALTGLLAPHLFHDRLHQVVSRFKRDKEDAAVVFIDLVNYSRIRTFHGSAVAEQSLLRSVIKLRRLVRDVDTVSRIGESRFGLILEGVSARAAVTDRVARLIAAGLMPLQGLKPDVTLQFHSAAVLLGEHLIEPGELPQALGAVLASMSPRTRRPIRYLDPQTTQPAPLDSDSMNATEEDSVSVEALDNDG